MDKFKENINNRNKFSKRNGRGGVVVILGDCGSLDPGSTPGPGPEMFIR